MSMKMKEQNSDASDQYHSPMMIPLFPVEDDCVFHEGTCDNNLPTIWLFPDDSNVFRIDFWWSR